MEKKYNVFKIFSFVSLTFGILIFAWISFSVGLHKPIVEYFYKTPKYENILSQYSVSDMFFSPNSPFAVFTYGTSSSFNDSTFFYSGGVGFLDLTTEESIILTDKNGQQTNSFFSPNGMSVLYQVARDQDIEFSKNEYGTWRTINGFDLYVYDAKNNTSTKINPDEHPLTEMFQAGGLKSVGNVPAFAWVDDNTVYYFCSSKNAELSPIENYGFCFVSLKEKKVTRQPLSDPYHSVNIPSHYDSKTNISYGYYGQPTSPNGKISIYNKCLVRGFDGCIFSIFRLTTQNKDEFLGKGSDLRGRILWSYDNHPYMISADGVLKLY